MRLYFVLDFSKTINLRFWISKNMSTIFVQQLQLSVSQQMEPYRFTLQKQFYTTNGALHQLQGYIPLPVKLNTVYCKVQTLRVFHNPASISPWNATLPFPFEVSIKNAVQCPWYLKVLGANLCCFDPLQSMRCVRKTTDCCPCLIGKTNTLFLFHCCAHHNDSGSPCTWNLEVVGRPKSQLWKGLEGTNQQNKTKNPPNKNRQANNKTSKTDQKGETWNVPRLSFLRQQNSPRLSRHLQQQVVNWCSCILGG